MIRKIVALGTISMFVMMSFSILPCISATITAPKLNEIVVSDQDETYSTTCISRSNPPLPPVMWTEDFSTFYIPTPQNPDGDDVFYLINWGDGTSSGWIGPYAPGETACISHDWTDEGTYEIKIKAKDQDGESKSTFYSLTLNSDFKFFGVKIGYEDIIYTFTVYWKDGEHYILIDWGDGGGEWIGPYEEPILFSKKWDLPGEYVLRLRLKDMSGQQSPWITLTIKILPFDNNAPDAPIITGPINGKIWVWYEYNFSLSDPDGDSMDLRVDWGIGGPGKLHGPFASGTIVTLKYSWRRRGTYTIRAQAIDIYGAESDWGTLSVTMPFNYNQYNQQNYQNSQSQQYESQGTTQSIPLSGGLSNNN